MSELDTENLTTVEVLAKMDSLLDYQAALKAVQAAAEELGCGFVNDGSSSDTMLPQVKECLAVAFAEWHVRTRYSKEGEYGWTSRMRVLRESGWAEARLNRMLAALDACGFVFRIGDDASLKTLVRFVDLIAAPENDPANYPPPIPEPPPSIKLHVS